MAYSTVADVQLNLVGFEIDAVADADTTITEAQVELFIAKADAYIDSILANVYTLPFTATIPMLKDVSTDMACYYILRRSNTGTRVKLSDWILQFYKDAEMKLEDIKKGNVSLVDDSGNVISFGSNMIDHNNEGYVPTFDIGDPIAWENDEDRLDAIEDAKE